MAKYAYHPALEKALCELVGVNPNTTTELTVIFKVGEPIRVEVKGFADIEGLELPESFTKTLKQYEVVPANG